MQYANDGQPEGPGSSGEARLGEVNQGCECLLSSWVLGGSIGPCQMVDFLSAVSYLFVYLYTPKRRKSMLWIAIILFKIGFQNSLGILFFFVRPK